MLQAYVATAGEREGQAKERLTRMRHAHTDARAGITRLLELAEKGLMDAEDPEMRERLVALKVRRDDLARQIADHQRQMASAEPSITPEKIDRIAVLLRDKLHHGPADLRQAYARLVLGEVQVTKEQIRISGPKSALARAASQGLDTPAPAVLSFVQEWRTRQDSNL
jgi:site-specific DNA recombinase